MVYNIKAVFYEENYPKMLLEIPDAPAVLFYKGTLPLENQKNIAKFHGFMQTYLHENS